MPTDPSKRVAAYHERTKHHYHRYARSLGFLDWDTQPDPFRTYAGAPRVELPLTADGVRTSYRDLYVSGEPRALTLESLGAFFELALGITAWKEYGESRWALRADPSSGNLHPTEGYAVLPQVGEVRAGVYHYVSRDHVLERRCTLDASRLPDGAFLVGVTSIHWREAWKYGERAYRYCQHDAGHVLATLRFAAAALGWRARVLDDLGDDGVARLLGLDRKEAFAQVDPQDREHPAFVMLVGSDVEVDVEDVGPGESWTGTANELSSSHVEWEVIDDVAEASRKPASRVEIAERPDLPPLHPTCDVPAATIIRQRRSAVALDGKTSISREAFYAMLDAVLPHRDAPPWDALPWKPRIHLGIFVHRVTDLPSGLYLLERDAGVHDALVSMLGEKALWTRPAGCPDHMRLFCIAERDLRRAAEAVSCGQEIAADGAFSLGMVAAYRSAIEEAAYAYPRLFWEAGALGQVLYLEAEAAGVRGTGIGCYFDDAFHEVLGLEGDAFQSLYHFTVGGPVEDTRLRTYAAYAHLERDGARRPRG